MPTFALVAPYLPAPDNTGGRIRIHRLARALARHGPVDLYATDHPAEHTPQAGDPTLALSLYRSVTLRAGDRGCVLPWFYSHRVRLSCPRSLREALSIAHQKSPYDAVVVCHVYAWAVASRLRHTVRVLDEHNIESAYALAVAPDHPRESRLLHGWERAVWPLPELVTACTQADASVVRTVRTFPVSVIPNGADVSDLPFVLPSERSSHEVLFVGAMSHPPNVRAAVRLVSEVLPALHEVHPDASVTLCGRAPAPEVRRLAGDRVCVTGTVPSVTPYLSRAGAYASLVDAGGGSSLKVIEALATGVPLVATSVSLRGHELVDERDVLVAETPRAVVQAILRSWSDPAVSDTRARAARAAVLPLDWNTLGDAFARDVLAAIASRAP